MKTLKDLDCKDMMCKDEESKSCNEFIPEDADAEEWKYIKNPNKTMPHQVSVRDLKINAIEWIKELERGSIFYRDKEKEITIEPLAIIQWIKHFFNISEEELK